MTSGSQRTISRKESVYECHACALDIFMTCQWFRKELTQRKVPTQPVLIEIAS